MKIEVKKVDICVAVPKDYVNIVRDVACRAGAGKIGDYSFCSSEVKCVGTFIPNKDAHPFIGDKEELEKVDEIKLDFICNIAIVKEVVKEIRRVHPYEEPVITIFPLLDENDF